MAVELAGGTGRAIPPGGRAGRVVAALLLLLLLHCSPAPAATGEAPAWRRLHARLAAQRDELGRALARARSALRQQVERRQPGLLARLDPPSPRPAAAGYALLPRLRPPAPVSAGPPGETRYALAELEGWLGREQAATREIEASLATGPADLAALIGEYGVRAENFRRIDQHVAYHALWQDAVHRGAVERREEVLAAWRTWREPDDTPAGRARAAQARSQLEAWSTGFSALPGLGIERTADGSCVLALTLATDIDDDGFLAAVADAIDQVWNQAGAMRAAGLRLELAWDRRPVHLLYPEGPPAPGARLDQGEHRRRFGDAAFVLTTGAETLHVAERAIFLAPGELNGRTLAHELSHLLGFADQYLRVFTGETDDPAGFTVIELVPFPASLLASSGSGEVTPEMATRLLEAYLQDRR